MRPTSKLMTRLLSAGGMVLVAAGSRTAVAAPLEAAARMPAQQLADLRREVAHARAVDPRPFATVSSIVALAPDANARARGRRAPIARYIARLGPSALLPALEMLALAPARGASAGSASDVRRDLIEAVGLLHDPRGLAVLRPILDDTSEDADTTRTVTEAIARIGTEEASTKILSALDAAHDDRARAIIEGMGELRRARVVDALAARLRSTNDPATARVAARSLGREGNAWAWQTIADRSEEARIRETAARALVDAFLRHDGEARVAASNALMVVDAPQTPGLIHEARKGATPEANKALDALEARFARNPARTR